MPTLELRYENYQAMLDTANSNDPNVTGGRSHQEGLDLGTETWDEAYRYASQGWPDGASRIAAMSASIQSTLGHLIDTERINYGTTGNFFDVARLCSGEPEHWAEFCPVRTVAHGQKYLAVTVSMGARWAVTPDEMAIRGAAIASLILLLEQAGIRTQVTVGYYSTSVSHSTHQLDIEACIKNYGDNLDLDRMAFALGNMASHRRIKWAIMEGQPEEQREILGVPGNYSVSTDKQDLEGIDLYLPLIEGGESHWQSVEAATTWVKDQLAKQGAVTLEGAVSL